MTSLRKFAAVAAASTALGIVALAASPAIAQGWYDGDYPAGGRGGSAPAYGYGYYGPQGYGPHGPRGYGPYGYDDYAYDTGETDIAICPPGYHLGRSARLCWPN